MQSGQIGRPQFEHEHAGLATGVAVAGRRVARGAIQLTLEPPQPRRRAPDQLRERRCDDRRARRDRRCRRRARTVTSTAVDAVELAGHVRPSRAVAVDGEQRVGRHRRALARRGRATPGRRGPRPAPACRRRRAPRRRTSSASAPTRSARRRRRPARRPCGRWTAVAAGEQRAAAEAEPASSDAGQAGDAGSGRSDDATEAPSRSRGHGRSALGAGGAQQLGLGRARRHDRGSRSCGGARDCGDGQRQRVGDDLQLGDLWRRSRARSGAGARA